MPRTNPPDWSQEIRAALATSNLDPAREASVVEELAQHLQDRYDEMLANGIGPEQACQTLLAELNDGTLASGLKATVMQARSPLPAGGGDSPSPFAGIWNDLRFGARLLRLNPGFATVAILSLALGIGANTSIFQLLDAVRLRSLPVRSPEQLAAVRVLNTSVGRRGNFYSPNADLTGPLWNRIREQQQGFSDIAAWSPSRRNLGQGGEAHYADILMVSGNFFSVLGVQSLYGRLLSPTDDYRGCGAQTAVVSHAFWQREFGGRPAAVDSKLTLDGHPFQIIGVTSASFYGIDVGRNFDVAIPICSEVVFETKGSLMDVPDTWWIATIGRLKPGWTLKRASAQLDSVSPAIFADTVPAEYDAEARKDYLSRRLAALPAATGVSELRRQYEGPLWLLLALSGLVLLIACANLANLMLARASVRQREMALRLTLGASRSRLIRQLLAESLLLAILGTAAGLALAQILSRVLVTSLASQQSQIFMNLTPDWRILGFTAAMAVLTCLLFGLAPAIQASATDPGVAIKAGGRGMTASRDRFLLRRVLVVSQVALSLVLLVGALLFVQTFRNLLRVNVGFEPDHLLVADFDFSPVKVPHDSRMTYRHELLTRMRAVPGVTSAAEILVVPMSYNGWDDNIDIPNGQLRQDVTFNRVSPGFFQTMQTPLIAGRDFDDIDTPKSVRVAIVNETFARKFFSGINPVGKLFYDTGKPDLTYQVVGLVGDTKYYALGEQPVPIAFLSFTQVDGLESSTLMIRSEESLPSLTSSIKAAANNVNPAIVLNFSVLKTQIWEGLLAERLIATLSSFFGVLATILAMVGLYGVISYMVIRRRNEIGVRIALGASRGNILGMVLRDATILVGIGLILGTGLSMAAGTAASSMLYGLKPRDPLTLGAAIVALALAALLASLLPAQRAAMVQPLDALREE